MSDFVIFDKLRRYVKSNGLEIGKDFRKELDVRVKKLVDDAIFRAKKQGKKRVRNHHL